MSACDQVAKAAKPENRPISCGLFTGDAAKSRRALLSTGSEQCGHALSWHDRC
jgi:hypothetical protein